MTATAPRPDCPSDVQIVDFAAGRLPPEETDQVADHVEHCETCQVRLAESDQSEAPSTDRLARQEGDLPYTEESQCLKALHRIERGGMPTQAGGRAELTSASDPTAGDESAARLKQVGEYRLLEPLGEGGMGAVYEARHAVFGTRYAVKLLHPRRRRDKQAIERFQREMVAIGQLDHPHIVRAMDAGEEGDVHYLVMEYVEGVDLSRLAVRRGMIDVADACEMIRQAALGLAHAHCYGRVHRDIKPSNLMLARSDTAGQVTIKILDLGLARFGDVLSDEDAQPIDIEAALAETPESGNLTLTNQVMGTMEYMAPEQASDSRKVDHRADIYSLGCTLFKLLAGRAPFGEPRYSTSAKQMLAHAQAAVPSIRQLRPDVPEELSKLIERMLAKKPESRPASAEEIAAALTPFTAGADLPQLLRSAGDPWREDTQDRGGHTVTMAEAVRKPAAISAPAASRNPPRIPWGAILFIAAAAFFVIGVTLVVLLMQMNMARGQLIVDADSPEAAQALASGQATIVDGNGVRRSLRPGEQLLRTGDYTLDAGKSGLVFEPGQFQLTRNARQVVTARLSPEAEWETPAQPRETQYPPVDLLSLIDIERDAARGMWRREGSAIVSHGAGPAPLQIPYRPPAEYRLEMVVERLGQKESLHMGLPLGDTRARAVVDSWPGHGYLAGPAYLDGQGVVSHRDRAYHGLVIPERGAVTLSYEVRRRGSEAMLRVERIAGSRREEIFTWRGEARRLSEGNRRLAPPTPDVFYLWSWYNPVRISRLRVFPHSAPGEVVSFAAPSADPDVAAAQRMLWKGGRVWVRQGEALQEIRRLADLPPRPTVERIEADSRLWLTGADLPYLANLANLRQLEFSGPPISAEQFAALSGLPQLKILRAPGAELAGPSAARLREFPELRALDLRGAVLDDAAMANIAQLTSLRELDLAYTGVSDADLQHLAELPELRRLNLDHTMIRDAGVASLSKLPALAEVSLVGTPITDAAIEQLAAMPALREANLVGTQITADGAAALRQQLQDATLRTSFDESLDLLKFVDLNWSEVAHGPWRFEGSALAIPSHSNTALAPITVSLPDEYDVELTAERTAGNDSLALLLHGGGRPFMVQFDQYPHLGSFTVIDMVDGKREEQNETHKKLVWFPAGEPIHTVFQVRRDQVRLLRNGEEVINWPAGYQRAWVRDYWRPEDFRAWGVGAHGSGAFRITEMKLRPVTGAAGTIPLRPTPQTSDRRLVNRLREIGAHVRVTLDGQTDQPLHMVAPLGDRPVWVRRIGNLQGKSLTAEDLALMGRAPQLRQLLLSGAVFEGSDLAPLAGHPSLREVWAHNTSLDDAALQHLGRIPHLEKLARSPSDPPRGEVTDEGVAHLANLNPLHLDLAGAALTDESLKVIGTMTRLRTLDLGFSRATGAGLGHLARLDDLQTLTLRGVSGLDAAAVGHLTEMPLLKTLVVSDSDFGDDAAARLAEGPFPHLTTLTAYATNLTDPGVQGLGSLPELQHLSLGNTETTDAAMPAIARLRGLRNLGLDNCIRVTNKAVAHLSQLNGLNDLRLTGTSISPVGVSELKRQLPRCTVHPPASGFDLTAIPGPPIPAPAGPTVDLPSLVDLDRDAPPGLWEIDGAVLTSAPAERVWLQIPYAPPSEYVIRAVVERVPGFGRDGPNLGLVVEGRQVRLAIDNWPHEGYLSGPHLLDGQGLEKHISEAYRGKAIPDGEPVEIVCAVTNRTGYVTIHVEVAGEKLLTWRGQASQLSIDTGLRPPAPEPLFLLCWNTRLKFHELELTPLAEGGRIIEFADPAESPTLAALHRTLWKGGVAQVRKTAPPAGGGGFFQIAPRKPNGAAAKAPEGPTVLLEYISELPKNAAELEIVALDSRGSEWFGDADMAYFAHLPHLRELLSPGAAVSDAGAAKLADLPNLVALDLSGAALTNKGLEHIATFPQLRRLRLSGTDVDNSAVDALAQLSQLVELDLSGARITDDALPRLADLEQLARLDLSRTAVTGASAGALSKAPALKELSFISAPVRDAAVDELAKLTGLERLSLLDTKMTEQGAAALKQRLPDCKVATDYDETIDLLSLYDPSWSPVRGEWTRRSDSLVLSERGVGLMMFPVQPPEEYDFEFVAKRTAGADGLAILLVGGGRKFLVEFDQFPQNGSFTVVDMIDDKRGAGNESHVRLTAFPIGETVRGTVEVRRDRVRVLRNGELLIDWPADYSRLGFAGAYNPPDPTVLGLGAWNSGFEFREAKLRPVTGKFNILPLRPTPANSDRELALWTQAQGGRVAVTFDGRTESEQVFAAGETIPARPLWLLRLAQIGGAELTEADFTRIADAEQLTELDLSHTHFDEAHLAHLAGHPSLDLLWLNDTEITDAALEHVGRIARLKRLHLEHTAVTDAGVAHFTGLENLIELRLERTKVSNAAMDSIVQLEQLRWLDFNHTHVTGDALEQVAKLSHLRTLYARRLKELDEEDVAHLEKLPNLIDVGLAETDIGDAHARQLARMRRLARVSLSHTNLTDAGVARLTDLPNLQQLYIAHTKATDAAVAAIAARYGVFERLGLGGLPLTDASVEPLTRLRGLTWLHLAGTQITPAGIARLRAAHPDCNITPPIVTLDFTGRPIGDEELPAAVGDVAPQVLILSGTNITDASLKFVGSLTTLEDLTLEDTQVSDAGLAHLASLPNLKKLDLNGTAVTDAGLAHLAPLASLHALRLGRTAVTGVGFRAIRELPLRTVQVGSADVTAEGFAEVTKFRTLVSLNVAGADISDEHLVLAEDLSNLLFLQIGWTEVTGSGLSHLTGLQHLENLVLTADPLDGAALDVLANMPSLTRLNLARTPIEDEDLQRLSKLTQLEELDLSETSVSEEAARALLADLPNCRILIDGGVLTK